MRYLLSSLASKSYWRYALLSRSAIAKIFAVSGGLYLFVEMLDFFHIYTRDSYSKYAFLVILVVAILFALFTRRPVSKVMYKIPNRDLLISVVIGDIFEAKGALIISANDTFETDMAKAAIAPDSLQGQVSLKYFQGNTAEIDRQLNQQLVGIETQESITPHRKKKAFPIGTVAKVVKGDKVFYFVAMSKWNEAGNAYSSVAMLDTALDSLWTYCMSKGELLDLALPLMGTGRGRIQLPMKKVIERIAQSFLYSSLEGVFSKKITIVVREADARSASLNLFEVRDYLIESLHT